MLKSLPIIAMILFTGLASPTRAQQWHVQNSPHDLSRTGPGPVRAVEEDQVCIFCHTPHNAAPGTPLWNRFDSPRHYRIYDSSTTDARIDQPKGESKLCLSCHDGVLAVGLLRSRGEADRVITTIPRLREGQGSLGTDLRDDHPISFRYDRALAAADDQLRIPDTISSKLPLGKHETVECSTCHDAHNNRLGNFLRITTRESAICTTCHEMDGWRDCSHAISPATISGRVVDPNETLEYPTVRDNGCLNCHKIHSAPHKERLLRFRREEDNCLNCHSGRVSRFNITAQIQKRSGHNVRRTTGVHDPAEEPLLIRPHVECVDCHNPHAVAGDFLPRSVTKGLAGPRVLQPQLKFQSGLSASGGRVEHARFEYEVCFKCHSDGTPVTRPVVDRMVASGNLRRDFRPSNASFHPVIAAGKNRDVPSLIAPLSESSYIRCTDCHNSDDARDNGGGGANGPHGSIYEPLLAFNYSTRDRTVESTRAYHLCYQCHDRSSILNDESFPLHRFHIVNEQTPCSVCHDPHGVPAGGSGGDHTNLINFDRSIVFPSDGQRRIEYRDTGRHAGNCTLSCHNFSHEGISYQR